MIASAASTVVHVSKRGAAGWLSLALLLALGCSNESHGAAAAVDAGRSDAATAGDCGNLDARVLDPCMLDATYEFSRVDDPFTLESQIITVTPSGSVTYQHVHQGSQGAMVLAACTVTLPACHDPTLVDQADLAAELSTSVVCATFGQPSSHVWGELGVADAGSFRVSRAAHPGFTVVLTQPDCTAPSKSCDPIPPAVHGLMNDIKTLQAWVLASCPSAHDASVPEDGHVGDAG